MTMTLEQMADELQAIIDGERPRLNKTEMREYVSDLRRIAQPAERVVEGLPFTDAAIDRLQDVMAAHGFTVPVRVISDAFRTAQHVLTATQQADR